MFLLCTSSIQPTNWYVHKYPFNFFGAAAFLASTPVHNIIAHTPTHKFLAPTPVHKFLAHTSVHIMCTHTQSYLGYLNTASSKVLRVYSSVNCQQINYPDFHKLNNHGHPRYFKEARKNWESREITEKVEENWEGWGKTDKVAEKLRKLRKKLRN